MIIKSRSVGLNNGVKLSRALAREALVELGRPVELRHRCPDCGGMGHGQPLAYLANFSLARIPHLVAAVATLGPPVGIAIAEINSQESQISQKKAQNAADFVMAARYASWKAWAKNPRIPVAEIEISEDQASWRDLSCELTIQALPNYCLVVAQQIPNCKVFRAAPVLQIKDFTP